MDNSGAANRTQSSNGQDANQLGNAVAAAVQRELQNQKRAGGILSPLRSSVNGSNSFSDSAF